MFRQFIFLLGVSILCCNARSQSTGWQSFLPAGYSILDSARGDLNRDGNMDYIVILKSKFEEVITDTIRPLLLLLGSAGGQYNLAERNDSVVMCRGCGGVFGDPYSGITIKNNFFSIEHYGGSNWRWTRIITFRFDTKAKTFLLHRDAGESWHTFDPGKTKQHVYGKEDFGKLAFSFYNYSKGW